MSLSNEIHDAYKRVEAARNKLLAVDTELAIARAEYDAARREHNRIFQQIWNRSTKQEGQLE